MGVLIPKADVLAVLANADLAARGQGPELEALDDLKPWLAAIHGLARDQVPKTYLAVLAIVLTARALYSRDELAVLEIQRGTSERGYSASSIGVAVAAFAKEHQVDLRATSSSPMNNHPFTFKKRLTADTPVNAKFARVWDDFFGLLQQVDALSSDDAKRVLALLFYLRRRAAATVLDVSAGGNRDDYLATRDRLNTFVLAESESGRVGQAFAAALLDCIYDYESVQQGNAQDPDVSKVGDVHVTQDGERWLWVEVKQKVISTGDITEFVSKVKGWGGERAIYLALANVDYSGSINPIHVAKATEKSGVDLRLLTSPLAAIDAILEFAPGDYGQVAADVVARMHARLLEAGCSGSLMSKFVAEIVNPLALAADLH